MSKVVAICKECSTKFTEWLSWGNICPECEAEVTILKDNLE